MKRAGRLRDDQSCPNPLTTSEAVAKNQKNEPTGQGAPEGGTHYTAGGLLEGVTAEVFRRETQSGCSGGDAAGHCLSEQATGRRPDPGHAGHVAQGTPPPGRARLNNTDRRVKAAPRGDTVTWPCHKAASRDPTRPASVPRRSDT